MKFRGFELYDIEEYGLGLYLFLGAIKFAKDGFADVFYIVLLPVALYLVIRFTFFKLKELLKKGGEKK